MEKHNESTACSPRFQRNGFFEFGGIFADLSATGATQGHSTEVPHF